MDARITPFGSHGVPLGCAFEAQEAISLQIYSFVSQDAANTAPSLHQGPQVRVSGERNAIVLQLYCVFASEDAADGGQTQHQGP